MSSQATILTPSDPGIVGAAELVLVLDEAMSGTLENPRSVARGLGAIDAPIPLRAPDGASSPWAAAIPLPDLCAPLVVAPEWLPSDGPEARLPVLRVHVPLRHGAPTLDFACAMRAIRIGVPGVIGIKDLDADLWWTADRLDAIFVGLPPGAIPPWVLWSVQAADDGDLGWVHTHGCARAGIPDLEIMEIEPDLVSAAAALIGEVAAQLLEAPPQDEPPFARDVAPGITIALVPVVDVVATMAAGTPGGERDRAGAEHGGPRLVVCDERQHGTWRACWVPPRALLRRMTSDREIPVWRGEATVRQRALAAQHTWAGVAEAFTAHQAWESACSGQGSTVRLIVQSRTGDGTAPAMPCVVRSADAAGADAVEAERADASAPARRLDCDEIADWVLVTRRGDRLEPTDHAAVAQVLADIRAGAADGSRSHGAGTGAPMIGRREPDDGR